MRVNVPVTPVTPVTPLFIKEKKELVPVTVPVTPVTPYLLDKRKVFK
jgi:hypothetical protein